MQCLIELVRVNWKSHNRYVYYKADKNEWIVIRKWENETEVKNGRNQNKL